MKTEREKIEENLKKQIKKEKGYKKEKLEELVRLTNQIQYIDFNVDKLERELTNLI